MIDFAEDRSVLTRSASPPDQVIRYGQLDEQLADIRFGKASASERPLLLFIHGGFWRPEFDRVHASPACVALAESGWTTASIEYRRQPGLPCHTLDDVANAIVKLPTLAKHHNGNAIVMGHSAGGHLALWAVVQSGATNLVGALALAPVADLRYAYELGIGNHAVREFIGKTPNEAIGLDPTRMATASIGITIVHGRQDTIVPLAISEHYAERHPKTRLVRIDGCGHFAVIDPVSAAWPQVIGELRMLSQ